MSQIEKIKRTTSNFMKNKNVRIICIPINGKSRYVIIDAITTQILENAQGYGFKSFDCADRYAANLGYHIIHDLETEIQNTLF